MAAQLPAFPRFVFTVLEPISLIAGCVSALSNPDWFIGEQLAQPMQTAPLDHSRVVALQLGNAYGLLFMVGVAVLYTTTELAVVRNYLVALLVADIGHLAVTYSMFPRGMSFADVAQWNAMTWGNVGATGFLLFTRVVYLLGLFGRDGPPAVASKKTR